MKNKKIYANVKGMVEKMKKVNRKGGAAVVALLIVIMLVAVGTAAMVVTGRNSIQVSKEIEPPMPDGYSTEESSLPESSAADSSEAVSSLVIPETMPSMLPNIANTYQTINIDELTCNSAVLLDAQTNEILAGYKYDKKIYPASLTKLLTLLVAAENIDDMDAKYKFTNEDIDPLIEENASRAGFEAGEEVSMEDLLYAAILVSGADGTLGLANSVAGSEEAFVELMNDKITELGLSDTKFVNASGLHDKEHYSTAQDIAVITEACLENDTCKEVLYAKEYTTSKTKQHEDGIVLESIFHSRYGGYWIDCDGDGEGDADVLGGKTGFTDEAMFTLSSVIEYDGGEYICVVTKSDDELKSVEDTIAVCEKYLKAALDGSEVEDNESSDDTSIAESSSAA